jgi:hypothetical protein
MNQPPGPVESEKNELEMPSPELVELSTIEWGSTAFRRLAPLAGESAVLLTLTARQSPRLGLLLAVCYAGLALLVLLLTRHVVLTKSNEGQATCSVFYQFHPEGWRAV